MNKSSKTAPVFDPLVEGHVHVEGAEPELPTNDLRVPLREPLIADRDPLRRRLVEDLDEALIDAFRTDRAVAVGLTQPDVEVLLVGDPDVTLSSDRLSLAFHLRRGRLPVPGNGISGRIDGGLRAGLGDLVAFDFETGF